jgi:hypothetical protein
VSTARRPRTTARTQVREPQTEERRNAGGVSPMTLAAASLASVVSAIVVSHIWGPGTLYGAAATPVIVALVSEALNRPKRVIQTARHVRSTRDYDPVAEGRRGLDEGDLATMASGGEAQRSLHRAPRGPPVPRRRGVLIALATGAVAFAVAAFALTGGELVFGHSAVGGVSSRTTLFGGSSGNHHKSKSASQGHKQQSTSSSSTKSGSSSSAAPTPTATTPKTTTPAPGSGTSTTPTTTSGSGGTAAPATPNTPSVAPPSTSSGSQSPSPPQSKTGPSATP